MDFGGIWRVWQNVLYMYNTNRTASGCRCQFFLYIVKQKRPPGTGHKRAPCFGLCLLCGVSAGLFFGRPGIKKDGGPRMTRIRMSISCCVCICDGCFFRGTAPKPRVCIYENDAILPKGVRTQNLLRITWGSARALLGFAYAWSCGRNRTVYSMLLCMSGFFGASLYVCGCVYVCMRYRLCLRGQERGILHVRFLPVWMRGAAVIVCGGL